MSPAPFIEHADKQEAQTGDSSSESPGALPGALPGAPEQNGNGPKMI
jgi:hypothetical protein